MPKFTGYRLNVGARYGAVELIDEHEAETAQEARDWFWRNYAFDEDEELDLRDEQGAEQ